MGMRILWFCFVFSALFFKPAFAGELWLTGNASLHVVNATLTMQCDDLGMSGTSVLILENGAIRRVGKLLILEDAEIVKILGRIGRCDITPARMLLLSD